MLNLLGDIEITRRLSLLVAVLVVLAILGLLALTQLNSDRGPGQRALAIVAAASPSPGPGRDGGSSVERGEALRRLDPSLLPLPDPCRGEPLAVDATAYGTFWDGLPSVAVAMHCDAGAGNPPSLLAVIVDDGSTGASKPRLAQVLVDPQRDLSISAVNAQGSQLTVEASGFSDRSVPRCCPNTSLRLGWRWGGRELVASS